MLETTRSQRKVHDYYALCHLKALLFTLHDFLVGNENQNNEKRLIHFNIDKIFKFKLPMWGFYLPLQ